MTEQQTEGTEMSQLSDAIIVSMNTSAPVDPTVIFGPQRDSLYVVLPITIIYTIIFVTGLLGNIFTCLVIVRNKSMHTATNYYLFSLAISDLLLLVSGIPQEMYSIWSKWPYVFGHTFCVLRGLAAETSTNASVLTITLFTIERHLAICHPFVSHTMSKLSRATWHVMLLWVVAFGLALPQALQFGIKDHRGVIMCLQTRIIIEHSFEISTFVFFFAPMILITVLYSLIGLKLRETSFSNQQSQKDFERSISYTHKRRRKYTQSTRRVIKMLVAVVIAFFVCWAPFHAQRLVAIYSTTENHLASSPVMLSVYSFLTYISGVFYYMSTCINPIFYHIMSNKFRDAFKDTMKMWCHQTSNGAATKRCSYTAMGFVRNQTSSGTANSGNSMRNETSIHNRSRRQDSRDKINNQTVQVCPDGNISEEQSQNYKSSFIHRLASQNNTNNAKDHSDTDQRHAKVNNVSIKPCSPICCTKQWSSDTLPTITRPEPMVNNNLEGSQKGNLPDNPGVYLKYIKSRVIQREKGYG